MIPGGWSGEQLSNPGFEPLEIERYKTELTRELAVVSKRS